MTERPATVKLTADEYKRLAEVVEGDIGTEKLSVLMATVIPPSDLVRLIRREEPESPITKEMTAKLVRGLADLHEGDREADFAWAKSVAEKTFSSEARAAEVVLFCAHRIKEFEDDEAADVIKEPIDLSTVIQHGKNRVDYSRMEVVDLLDYANIEGSGVRFRDSVPPNWWRGTSNAKDFVRMHGFYQNPGETRIFGGHFDWKKQGQVFKTMNNFTPAHNYFGESPKRGAKFWFFWVSNDARFRTDIVESKTKYGE